MKDKHPIHPAGTSWPELPPTWSQDTEIDISDELENVVRELDPKTGVGPRCQRPDHIKWLYTGVFHSREASAACDRFAALGAKYLSFGMPAWLRACLGGGLLTPLNKAEPNPSSEPDARPVKAEDTDTSTWCKALGRQCTSAVTDLVKPQQLGVGISGGVEMLVHGFRIKFEEAEFVGKREVFVAIDIKNAHNSFPRDKAQAQVIEAAHKDPRLIPLAIASESTLRAANPIYMRSRKTKSGYIKICDSLMGGGQGNALTSLNYVINQDPAMKGTEARFPTVEFRAIQDDITMRGPPEVVWGADGALAFLLTALKERGLEPNIGKFSVVGTTEDACDNKQIGSTNPSLS